MLVAARASSWRRYLQISWALLPGTKMSKLFRQVRVRQIFGVLVMFKVRSDGEHLKEKEKLIFLLSSFFTRPVEFGKSQKSLFSYYKI
jgi:hypothetical protein